MFTTLMNFLNYVVLPIAVVMFAVCVLLLWLWPKPQPAKSASPVPEQDEAKSLRSSLTPSEVVKEFDLEDAVKLDDRINTTFAREIVFGFWCVICVLAVRYFYVFLLYLGLSAGIDAANDRIFLGLVMVLCVVAALSLALSLEWFFFRIQPMFGVVLTNYFTGRMHVFGPGVHLKFPWEVTASGLVTTRLDLRTFPIEENFFSKDGVSVGYHVTVQYEPRLRFLPLLLRIEEGHVRDAIRATVRKKLAIEILGCSSDQLHKKEKVQQLGQLVDLLCSGRSEKEGKQEKEGEQIENLYGIKIRSVALSEPTFSQDYVDSTTAEAVAGRIAAAAKRLQDFGMSAEAAANSALILNKKDVKRRILTVEGGEVISSGLSAVVASLMKPK